MPIDKMFTEPMLNPFRDMLRDCETKNLTGPDLDNMRQCLSLMENYAEEMSDFAAYSGRLAQEQLFQKFSDAYGRVLTKAAQSSTSAQPTDDELLAQTLSAYEQTLQSYRSGQAGPAGEKLIPVMERMVMLGKSGVTYPVYLRKLEEEGLNRALDGAAPAVRDALEQDLRFAQESWLPRHVEKAEKILALFDRLAATAPFGQPQPIEFQIGRSRIEWLAEPGIVYWQAAAWRWYKMLEMLVDWIDSFTSFAPHDERWMPMGGGDPWPNIYRTRQCQPGDFRHRERLLDEYYGITWKELFRHETFMYEFTANRVPWSDERIRLICDTYPVCVPGGEPPKELIDRAEKLHPQGDLRPERFKSPQWGTPLSQPCFTRNNPD